eukprot:6005509-Amphidinium_carterae.1
MAWPSVCMSACLPKYWMEYLQGDGYDLFLPRPWSAVLQEDPDSQGLLLVMRQQTHSLTVCLEIQADAKLLP